MPTPRKRKSYEIRDDTTLQQKVALRKKALLLLEHPIVLETHGGTGLIYRQIYRDIIDGIVFETDSDKAEILAWQRPTWSVYQTDCIRALEYGVGSHLTVNLLDIDPYGMSWPAIAAFLGSKRPRAKRLIIVVNDGGRMHVRFGRGWNTKSMVEAINKFGNNFAPLYLEVCEWYITEQAIAAGYRVNYFHGYYCGNKHSITHFLAELVR